MRQDIYRQLAACLDDDRLVAVASVVSGPGIGQQLLIAPARDDQEAVQIGGLGTGGLSKAGLERQVLAQASEQLASFQSQRHRFTLDGAGDTSAVAGQHVDVFIEIHPPRPKLIIVGAVHVAAVLVTFAKVLGFKTIVIDPRTAFATPERFAHADELSTDWPDQALRAIGINENTYVVLLSHDQKLDIPALQVALPSPARYIGALGSKKTHRKRVAALQEAGIDDDAIDRSAIERIHNPIGLDLGGRRAEEIATAIIAEMIAVNHGKA